MVIQPFRILMEGILLLINNKQKRTNQKTMKMNKTLILIIILGMMFNANAQKFNNIYIEADSLYKVGDYFNAYLGFKKAGRYTNRKLCKAYMDTSMIKMEENRIELNQNKKKIIELNYIIGINIDSIEVLNKNIVSLEDDKNNINNDLLQEQYKNINLENDTARLTEIINTQNIRTDSFTWLVLKKDSLIGEKEDLILNKNSIIENN